MPLSAGVRLGPYEISVPLGAGGMGEVYRARDDAAVARGRGQGASGRALLRTTGRLKRFEKEARAASSLNHPNIVTIYDVGLENGVPYMAMERVGGQTLRADSRARDRFPAGSSWSSPRRSPKASRRRTKPESCTGI